MRYTGHNYTGIIYGFTEVEVATEIRYLDDLNAIARVLADKNAFTEIVIDNYILLRSGTE